MWEHFPCHYCPTTGIVLFNSNHRWWVAYKGDLTDIKRRWAEYNFELTVSSCTLWLCQSWSWWGRCSLQPFLPATQKIFFLRVKTNRWLQTTSWQWHLPLNCSRPLLLFCPVTWRNYHASKSNSSVMYVRIRVWRAISDSVSFRKTVTRISSCSDEPRDSCDTVWLIWSLGASLCICDTCTIYKCRRETDLFVLHFLQNHISFHSFFRNLAENFFFPLIATSPFPETFKHFEHFICTDPNFIGLHALWTTAMWSEL